MNGAGTVLEIGKKTRNFRAGEIVVGIFVAIAAQIASVSIFENADTVAQEERRADISDDNAKAIPVNVVPLLDERPFLKLGSKDPSALPDMWQKPKPKAAQPNKPAPEKKDEPILPSSSAKAEASAIPDSGVTTDAESTVDPDAELTAGLDIDAAGIDGGPDPKYANKGDPTGCTGPNCTETDPAKAQAYDMYRGQLNGWFSARFAIKGKVPCDELVKLKGIVTVQVNADRQVAGYSVAHAGNATYDSELEATMARIKGGGEILPAPPPLYPDVINKGFTLGFQIDPKNCQ